MDSFRGDNDDDDVYQARTFNTAASPPSARDGTDTFSISSSHYEENCGWSKCKPTKFQKMNSPKWFLFFLAVFSVSQSKTSSSFFIFFVIVFWLLLFSVVFTHVRVRVQEYHNHKMQKFYAGGNVLTL